jgi:hypothetical protein
MDATQLCTAMRAALIKYGRYQGAADVGPTWLRLQQRLNHLRAEIPELRAQAELEDALAEARVVAHWASVFERALPDNAVRTEARRQRARRQASSEHLRQAAAALSLTPHVGPMNSGAGSSSGKTLQKETGASSERLQTMQAGTLIPGDDKDSADEGEGSHDSYDEADAPAYGASTQQDPLSPGQEEDAYILTAPPRSPYLPPRSSDETDVPVYSIATQQDPFEVSPRRLKSHLDALYYILYGESLMK